MPPTTYHLPIEETDMIRRWVTICFVCLLPLLCVAAFVAMARVRALQGHGGQIYPSEISGLAIREAPADSLADARRRGEVVYRHYCQICHGEKGKADGFNSANLERPPRDLTDPKFWQQTTGERTYYAVSEGGLSVGKSVLMPAWGHTLTERQIRDVITFIRAFAEPRRAEAK
jgi:cytochrome c oxidase cbb3-type subunit III